MAEKSEKTSKFWSRGFLGLVATVVSSAVLLFSDNLSQRRSAIDTFRTAVTTYADQVQDRFVNAGMVVSSIRRGVRGEADLEELKDRKRIYDQSYRITNATSFSQQLQFSPTFSKTAKGRVLLKYMLEDIPRELIAIDNHITAGYGRVLATGSFEEGSVEVGDDYTAARRAVETCIEEIVAQVDYFYREPEPLFYEFWKKRSPVTADQLDAKLDAACQ